MVKIGIEILGGRTHRGKSAADLLAINIEFGIIGRESRSGLVCEGNVVPFAITQIGCTNGIEISASNILARSPINHGQGRFSIRHVLSPFDDGAHPGLRCGNIHPDGDTPGIIEAWEKMGVGRRRKILVQTIEFLADTAFEFFPPQAQTGLIPHTDIVDHHPV